MAQNMTKFLKQAQKLQAQMTKAQEELNRKEIEGSAGGGMVKVVINGAHEVLSVSLKPEVVDPDDIEMLEELIVAACNNAHQKIQELSQDAFSGIAPNLPL